MPKSAAERKAEQRARAQAKGLCVVCCRRKARPGKATCKTCYVEAKARLYALRDKS